MGYGIPRNRKVVPCEGNICEDCDNQATWEIAGETDSFGTEWVPLCSNCKDIYDKGIEEEGFGPCDVCGSTTLTTRSRDPSEGSHGPVYIRCALHSIVMDD